MFYVPYLFTQYLTLSHSFDVIAKGKPRHVQTHIVVKGTKTCFFNGI